MLITFGVDVNILFRILYWICIQNQQVLTVLIYKLQPSIGKSGAQLKIFSVLLNILKQHCKWVLLLQTVILSANFHQVPPYLTW